MSYGLTDLTSGKEVDTNFIGYQPMTGIRIGEDQFDWENMCKVFLHVFVKVSMNAIPQIVQEVLMKLHKDYQPIQSSFQLSRHAPVSQEPGQFCNINSVGQKAFCVTVDEDCHKVRFGLYIFSVNDFCCFAYHIISGGFHGITPTPQAVNKLLNSLFANFHPMWIRPRM